MDNKNNFKQTDEPIDPDQFWESHSRALAQDLRNQLDNPSQPRKAKLVAPKVGQIGLADKSEISEEKMRLLKKKMRKMQSIAPKTYHLDLD